MAFFMPLEVNKLASPFAFLIRTCHVLLAQNAGDVTSCPVAPSCTTYGTLGMVFIVETQ